MFLLKGSNSVAHGMCFKDTKLSRLFVLALSGRIHADRVATEQSYTVSSQQQQQKKARSLPSFLNKLGDEPHTSTAIKSKPPDGIFNYASAILNDGLLVMELRDAIHEGDGDRIMRAWKFMLGYFRFGRHTNYSGTSLNGHSL